MPVRSREQLRRDQHQLLAEYRRLRRQRESVAQLPTHGAVASVVLYGRVTQVVSSDPTFGAHLVVAPQDVSGTPPVFSDSTAASVRCYPAPNHVVGDYTVNEKIKVLTVRGAFIADKSA